MNINTPDYWDTVYSNELVHDCIRVSVHNYCFFHKYILPNDTVLDIGAGTGSWIKNLLHNCVVPKQNICAVDFSNVAARNLRKYYGITVLQGDIRSLPFLSSLPRSDVVTCFHTLEHVENFQDIIIFLHALAKKYLIIVLPLNDPWKEHLYVFDMELIKKIFHSYNPKYYVSNFSRGEGTTQSTECAIIIKKNEE